MHSCFLRSSIIVPKAHSGNCTSGCKHHGCLTPTNAGGSVPVDLWKDLDDGESEGPAHGYNNSCDGSGGSKSDTPGGHPYGCSPGPLGDHSWFDGYEDEIFEHQVLNAVEKHDPTDNLFLFWAPHIVHAPLEVPSEFFLKFRMAERTDKAGHERQLYHAMVNFADTAIGNLTDLLKAKGTLDVHVDHEESDAQKERGCIICACVFVYD